MATVPVPISIRMYHVGFGDCFLVTIPGPQRAHRVLVDCGVHSGTARKEGDPEFRQIVEQIIGDLADMAEAGAAPRLDVVVVTHRHRDHVHGFSFRDVWKGVSVGEVWMPWVENPDDPVARGVRKKQDDAARLTFHALRSLSATTRAAANSSPGAAQRASAVDEAIDIVYNSTANAVAFEQLHGKDGFTEHGARPRYLPRNGDRPDRLGAADLGDLLPNTLVHVLGPSHDPRVMRLLDPPDGAGYLRLLPADDTVSSDALAPSAPMRSTAPRPFGADWHAPEGAYKFGPSRRDSLRELCAGSLADPMAMAYSIDHAVNGTSLVLVFEIGGVKLLFPGDAQWGTWEMILEDDRASKVLDGVTFLKVGHHGSHNATPKQLVETKLGPQTKAAMIPVARTNYRGGWAEIPKGALVEELGKRTLVLRSDVVATDQPAEVVRTDRYTEIVLQAHVAATG